MKAVFGKIAVFSALLAGLVPVPAMAAGTFGGMLDTTVASFSNFPVLLSVIAYITGFFFLAIGLFKFKDHVDMPQQHPLSGGIKRFIAGGMFLSLPYMASVVRNSLFAGAAPLTGGDFGAGAAAGGGAGGVPLDRMVVNFMTNIAGPAQSVLSLFCYIAGFMLLMVGINRLTKRLDDGPRGPAGMGTLMTFVAASALFAIPGSMGAMVFSLFGDNADTSTVAILGPNIVDAASAPRIQAVIESVMVFIAIVGMIAFIRGWLVLKAFADGQQSATIAQGLTFLFGGALAINLGELVEILQTTLGLTCGGGALCLTFN
jgi:intracellular multiplication protein IcmC